MEDGTLPEMYTVSREIHFCYGHRLLRYPGKCRHLHGHNARVEIELFSEKLDAFGMVRDFEVIKQHVESWILETLDHKMILSREDPILPALKDLEEPFYAIDAPPTAEAISKLIFDYAEEEGLPVLEVRLWETPRSYARYRRT